MARQRVDYSVISNQMSKFLLDDGTEIRVQCCLMDVVRTGDKLPDGQPAHHFQFQTVVHQIAPEGKIDIKKLAGGDQ